MPNFHLKFETVKHENYAAFLEALGTAKERIAPLLEARPTVEISLNETTLTLNNSISGAKNFTLNREVDESFGDRTHKVKINPRSSRIWYKNMAICTTAA